MRHSFSSDILTNVDFDSFIDISIPLNFHGPQPNVYGVAPAISKPCEASSLVGDTRRGGSCNFEQYTFIPHCNGTHTEGAGHITHERISIRDCLRDVFIPAVLISIEPVKTSETDEKYVVEADANDYLITRKTLVAAFERLNLVDASEPYEVRECLAQPAGISTASNVRLQPPATAGGSYSALVVRTFPNDESKLTRQYGMAKLSLPYISPFFSTEAIEYIVELGVKHLLVDLPSVDRLYDEGKLSNHRIFWNIEQGSFETNPFTRINNTITELIYVPNKIKDGNYLLNLQIAPFATDASPSRPILFKLT